MKSPVETIDATETWKKLEETNPTKKISAVWKLFMVPAKEYVWVHVTCKVAIDIWYWGILYIGIAWKGVTKLRISLGGSKGVF